MKAKPVSTSSPQPSRGRDWLWILLPVLAILVLSFSKSFVPGQALFANDGPIGVSKCRIYEMPSGFLAIWADGNWLGGDNGSFPPNFYGIMRFLFGPVGYVNFSAPVSLLVLGFSAGLFFRTLGFSKPVCALGALAAALNGNFFSNSCWGLPSRATGLAMAFLALAALNSALKGRVLVKTVLAGLAIGMSISESGDNGAFFSLFVAAFAVFLRVFTPEPLVKRAFKCSLQVGLMAICAALMAAQTLNIFVTTSSVKGIVGLEGGETMGKEQKWNWATQWSLPKAETLRVVIPGLFGYRMDSPKGGNYWGRVGQDPSWPETHQGLSRHSGAGEYAGVLVVLIGLWAIAHSLWKKDSVFSAMERKTIWFWTGALIVAVLLSWGRHAPFYQFIYSLPYFSAIRNPMKFMHPGHLCILILFGYGLQGIWKRYLAPATVKAQDFEKKWLLGSLGLLGASIFGWIFYASSQTKLEKYLGKEGFENATLAREMAKFSINEVMVFVFFLALSVVALILIQRGTFAGAKRNWAIPFLGLILIVDLARADVPWIKYYDYKEKYAPNPILEILGDKPWEHRVTMALSMGVTQEQFTNIQKIYRFTQAWMILQQVYSGEWMQHQFPFNNVQVLDTPQEPRLAAEKKAYLEALTGKTARLYELTTTRYILGLSGNFADALNDIFDPQKRRFRTRTTFNFVRVGEESVGAQPDPAGPFALIEFTGALPRANLYSKWEVSTNATDILNRLSDPAFDPAQTVLLGSEPPVAAASATNVAPGKTIAEIVNYAPKKMEIRTESAAPGVLMVNDKFDPSWKVWVDNKPQELLRCNLLVRGVAVPAGLHTVVFRYQPPTYFWWTFSFVTIGLILSAYLLVDRRRTSATRSSDSLAPVKSAKGENRNAKP